MSTAPTGQQKPQNVRQADSSQPDRSQPNAEPSQRNAAGQAPGAATVKTTDPVVNSGSERQSRWNEHPERAITLETHPAEGATPDVPLGEPRDVVESKAAASGGRRDIAPDEPAGHESQPDAGRLHAEEKLRHNQPGDHKKREHGDKPSKHERGGREHDEHQRRHHERSHHERDHHDHHDGHHHPRKKKKHKHRDHAAPAPAAPGWKTLLMTGVLALVCGVAGAWGYSYFAGDSSKADEQSQGGKKEGEKSGGKSSGKKSGGSKEKSGGSSEQGDQATSPRQIPEFTSADDAETLKKQIKHLDDRIDRLSQRIDRVTTPEEETPPVLRTLQIQMSDLAKEVGEVANLPSQVHQLEQRLASITEQMKTMRARRASSTASFDAGEPSDDESGLVGNALLGDSPSDDGSTPPAPIDDDTGVADATLDLAIGLFQEGQYAQARQVLVRLQRARPQDARVWYYSALTNGLTTGVWDGETKMLLDKAIKRERAGTPSRAQVDAALAGVKADQGKSWLARQRQPVAKSKSHRNY